MKQIIVIFTLTFLALTSCNDKQNEIKKSKVETTDDITATQNIENTITNSTKHKPNFILCDLDGDNLSDTVTIVMNKKNKKYGLKIIFGTKEIEYLGLGKEVLGQDFDDLNWVGTFEVAPKGEAYFTNVDGGEIITEEDVKESDKIKLPNDGIYIQAHESCGGGVIYLNNGKFDWIQQE